MFTYIWESLSPQQRHRALYCACIASLCAYLLLALVGEPLQSFQMNPEATASLLTLEDYGER